MNQEPVFFSSAFARADMKPEYFDNVIKQKGYTVVWEQAMLCSCMETNTGQPDYNCPSCLGKGYTYFNPTPTKVVVTSISGRKEQEKIGLNDVGSAYLTPVSTDNIGIKDRFTFLDFRVKYSQIVHRGPESSDMLRYPCLEILNVRKLGTPYVPGVDFKISQDRKSIEWLSSDIPSGDRYSVLYMTMPVYIAMSAIHELRGSYTLMGGQGKEQFMQLPSQYQIKREDFLENDSPVASYNYGY